MKLHFKRVVVKLAVLCLVLMVPAFCYAAEGSDINCTYLQGRNVNAQNYSTWTSPITSYLVDTGDQYMRVQGIAGNKISVVYYDKDFNINSREVISSELPVFGAFYNSGSNYYVVSGQKNTNKDDAVEVFRITKFDTNWNRIASCNLKGANTMYPFDAGSCRMDMDGKYLLIRTCHEMYSGHQANVTIEVDTSNMTITDSFTETGNNDLGYVSHSFNQFIKIENHKIVSVDHGDTYPRSICLMNYPKDISSGTFTPSYYEPVQTTDVMAFMGNPGDNYTNASVGGFEISSSAYLIAGNSIVQDADYSNRSTRNVFIASVNKTSKAVTLNWITDYDEGETSASTPQFVKITDNKYAVLWGRSGKVYYTFVNGTGVPTSGTYEMEGTLSDCVPIVSDNKLVWYSWNYADETFYSIPISNPSQPVIKAVNFDHDFETVSVDDNGLVSLRCTKCGHEKTAKAPTSFYVYWKRSTDPGYYYSSLPAGLEAGESIDYMIDNIKYSAEADESLPSIIVEADDKDNVIVNNSARRITFNKVGTYILSIYPEYNPSVKITRTVRIVKPLESVELNTEPSEIRYGGTASLIATPEGGKGSLKYTFVRINDDGTETKLTNNTTNSVYNWRVPSAGTFKVRVDVTDSLGDGEVVSSPVIDVVVLPARTAIKDGKEIVAADELTYGQKTSEAEVKNAVFVAEGTSRILDGEFVLGEPDKVLPAGNQLVSWTFTPSNSNYEPLTGEVIIPVKKAVPEVESLPAVAEAPYHPETKLENRALSGGEVSVPGIWSWDDPDIVPEAGSDEFTAVFTPEDQDNYEQVTAQVEVTTLKASPVVTDLSATEITYGDSLEKSELSGSAAYSNTDSTSVAGSFAWKNSSEKPSVADSESTEYDVVFTPADNRNYESIESKVKIKVNKADRPEGAPSGVINVGFGTETVDQSILSDYPGWEFDASDIGTPLDAGETSTFTVTYTGADAGNYNNLTAEVSVFRSTCDHKDLTKFEGSPNNCLQPGIREHWQCNTCGKYFADSEARNEIEENSWIIPPQHTLEFVEAHEYCDQTGNIAHWHCVVCNRLFLDENAEEFRQYDDIYSVEPIGHDWGEWKVVKESEYPCAGAGQEVRICKRNSEHVQYRDIELLAHEIEHVDGVDPTCTEDGNIEYWYCSVCGQLFSDEAGTTTISEDETVIPTPGHQWDEGRITTEATTSKPGEKVFTCTVCGETMTETIPQLPDPKKEVGEDGTAVGPGASIVAAETAITGMKSDKDPAGTVFGLVQLKSTKQTKTSVTLKWKKVAGATKYYVYGNMCGSANRMVRQTIVNGTSLKVTKVIGNNKKAAKVKKGKYYKFVVVAVNSQGRVVSTSKVVHVATKGGKIGNHKKVITKAKKNKVTIKKGKKFKLAGKAIPGKLKVKNHRKVAYESSNKAIATVNSKGQIKGVKKGKCYIYAYAQNGIFAKIKVTVK